MKLFTGASGWAGKECSVSERDGIERRAYFWGGSNVDSGSIETRSAWSSRVASLYAILALLCETSLCEVAMLCDRLSLSPTVANKQYPVAPSTL